MNISLSQTKMVKKKNKESPVVGFSLFNWTKLQEDLHDIKLWCYPFAAVPRD